MIELALKKKLLSTEGELELSIKTTIENGEFVAFFGESGAGKTTVLRMIAGLETPDAGRIVVDGETWFDSRKKIDLPPAKRKIGFVFQDYALFPNMTVAENLRFALQKGENPVIVDELIETIGLRELADRLPSQLSGGQQQRVAVARALVRRPRLLLLDEPLSALDHAMRIRLQDELAEIHKRFKLTTILVSHDPSEIFRLCGSVYRLERGEIKEVGTPSEVFVKERISSSFKFVGEVLAIEPCEMVYLLTVAVGTQIVKIMATEREREGLRIGSRIQIVSKAFHPMIFRAETAKGNSED
ncbi:sulfate/molybdate ABC transporter ATP-binding protein [Hydrogenimonas cancrithermarum]|uniref:GTPase n=1 Tax=Hydrogenimonas cancrithermarum TaxID=2993563 RepID=A0ABN6WVD1_9BACT|nr:ATP-binding cassette domain-containing protein [Hydrogenimonas cancrithermarum]BDY12918.1 GTPase [Hydrogenimonas cancrithermarum]BDY13035.1 GTPase [Hydrogenimonas cancrithermarum]